MKTKAQIVQDLLNEDKITAEDAVVLLTKEKEYIAVPQQPSFPYNPVFPYNPYPSYPVGPIYVHNGDSPNVFYSGMSSDKTNLMFSTVHKN